MFDMNKLWEQFVYVSLRKHKKPNATITAQTSKLFWQLDNGYRSKIRPDIVINKDKDDCVVLDTKWKNLNGYNPSPDDLRQMYVYHQYYNAKRVALIYPGIESFKTGVYLDSKTGNRTDNECSVICLSVETNIKKWQENINIRLETWMTNKV
jgi:5-methylcytosine-specific restriction enzyme subunit McrC